MTKALYVCFINPQILMALYRIAKERNITLTELINEILLKEVSANADNSHNRERRDSDTLRQPMAVS
jgi:hypothetical protein